MKELIYGLLEPILGEVATALVTILIAMFKRWYDKDKIKKKTRKLLERSNVPLEVINDVVKVVDNDKISSNGQG